jgi:hypothetical protein
MHDCARVEQHIRWDTGFDCAHCFSMLPCRHLGEALHFNYNGSVVVGVSELVLYSGVPTVAIINNPSRGGAVW